MFNIFNRFEKSKEILSISFAADLLLNTEQLYKSLNSKASPGLPSSKSCFIVRNVALCCKSDEHVGTWASVLTNFSTCTENGDGTFP